MNTYNEGDETPDSKVSLTVAYEMHRAVPVCPDSGSIVDGCEITSGKSEFASSRLHPQSVQSVLDLGWGDGSIVSTAPHQERSSMTE